MRSFAPSNSRRSAFTLVEALFVLAIVAILAVIFLPAFSKTRTTTYDATSIAHLHQLGIGITLYSDDHGARLPSAERMPSTPIDPLNPLPRICDIVAPYIGTTNSTIFRCRLDKVGYYL